jgi:hypothetical protein
MNLVKDKWIDYRITVPVNHDDLKGAKDWIKKYVDDLGWELSSEDNNEINENGNKMVNIILSPEGGSISPGELAAKLQNIIEIGFIIFSEILYNVDYENLYNVDFERAKENFNTFELILGRMSRREKSMKKNKVMGFYFTGFNNISYKLIDRVNLEKKNKGLALKIFRSSVENSVHSLFGDEVASKEIENQDLIKCLEESFGFDLHKKKSKKRTKYKR